ncbi:c2607a8d-04e6-4e1b-9319-29b6924052e5 [Sclerotinia trifoliorum]|uniref:C2607a8d-04e6-4e1b-9319-29b6924052e5 n=1 Tax=Sclerotinia trifoliorum TaxID=28548 RepID=A0A8H2VQS2_9HELO|nr:c2607a8d-04e6-4e1b-9319-29b6924052e5 [Sclerotinia trifoliorum]
MSSLFDLNIASQENAWSSLWILYEGESWPVRFSVKCENALRERKSFFYDLGLHSTPNNPIFLENSYKDSSVLLMRCLQGEDMYTVLKSHVQKSFTDEEKDNWSRIVIHLCALCEKWGFPLIFNEAMFQFAILQDSPMVPPEHILLIYKLTVPGSSLRRLAVDIVMSEEEGGTGELRQQAFSKYKSLFSDQVELLDAMWAKFQFPLSSFFRCMDFRARRHWVNYNMKV